jgi:hypothetical protein
VRNFKPSGEIDEFLVSQGHHLYSYIDCTILGQGRNLEEPLLLFSWPEKYVFYQGFKFSVKREAMGLMRLVENSNSDNLYSRQECLVASKVF